MIGLPFVVNLASHFFCDSVRAAGCGDSLTGHLYSGYAACDANSGLILCSESLLSILSNSQVASEYFHCGHIDKIKHLSQRPILVNFFQTSPCDVCVKMIIPFLFAAPSLSLICMLEKDEVSTGFVCLFVSQSGHKLHPPPD